MKEQTLNKLNNVLKGLVLSKEQKQQLVEVFDEVSSSGGGSGIKQTSVDIYCDDDTYQPSYIMYDNKRVDILAENEGGFGTVFRIRDTDFYEWFKENKSMYVNIYSIGMAMTVTAIIGYMEGESTYETFNATLSVIMPTMGDGIYTPSIFIHIEIFPTN